MDKMQRPQINDRVKGDLLGRADKSHLFIWLACPDCGKERWVAEYKARNVDYKLKCKSCGRQGDKSPNWKGGKSPYYFVYLPTHHHASKRGYVAQHIVLWEEYNNKILLEGWVIHHINGNKKDNRKENLLALPRNNHHYALKMHEQQKRIRELEAELKAIKSQAKLNL